MHTILKHNHAAHGSRTATLTPVDRASPFYEKLGFQVESNGDMSISDEAAKKLLEEKAQ